jgi:endonuclease YncB( thermonuclease family)
MEPFPRAVSPLRYAVVVPFALAAGSALLHQYGYLPLDLAKGTSTQRRAETSDKGGKLLTNATAVDGDSLRADGEEIRLLGIDAPELRQTCRDQQGRNWACGRDARDQLRRILARGKVRCALAEKDRYGRSLARCSASGVLDIGDALVRDGFALNFMQGDYRAAEGEARSAKRGIWRGEFERPAIYRERTRETAQR